jgi:hypothetical protein
MSARLRSGRSKQAKTEAAFNKSWNRATSRSSFQASPWNWPWRIVTVLLGCFILAVFVALLNTLTPSGRIAVIGRVV